uniref:Uncharacterized protein n=1 Tax=Nelumbo nucifera TaxID=4432 RepID=A0A822YCS0_NELNU|nr:TPA_asm: hypothetical protein HUJ06_030324 [Nelumbo nucifera]
MEKQHHLRPRKQLIRFLSQETSRKRIKRKKKANVEDADIQKNKDVSQKFEGRDGTKEKRKKKKAEAGRADVQNEDQNVEPK